MPPCKALEQNLPFFSYFIEQGRKNSQVQCWLVKCIFLFTTKSSEDRENTIIQFPPLFSSLFTLLLLLWFNCVEYFPSCLSHLLTLLSWANYCFVWSNSFILCIYACSSCLLIRMVLFNGSHFGQHSHFISWTFFFFLLDDCFIMFCS